VTFFIVYGAVLVFSVLLCLWVVRNQEKKKPGW